MGPYQNKYYKTIYVYHYSSSLISSCYCIILHQCIASWYCTVVLHHIAPWYCTMLQQNRFNQDLKQDHSESFVKVSIQNHPPPTSRINLKVQVSTYLKYLKLDTLKVQKLVDFWVDLVKILFFW